jgi:hypothetical protein
MPIPALQENGFLPPGLYLANLDEIWERFGRTSERRRMLFNRLQMFVDAARHVEALRMFVAGSYVTAKTNPRDVKGKMEDGGGKGENGKGTRESEREAESKTEGGRRGTGTTRSSIFHSPFSIFHLGWV